MSKILYIICVIACYLFLAGESLAQETSQTTKQTRSNELTIAFIDNDPPLSTRLPNGEPAGYLVEFWQLWAETNGISIEWVGGNYEDNIELLKSGKADFQAGLFRSEKRKQWADFSLPITQIRTAIYFLPESYHGQRLSASETPIVAVGKYSYQENILKKTYPNIQLFSFENGRIAISAMLDSQVDAIIAEVPYMNAQLGLLGIQGALTMSDQVFSENTEHAMFLKSRAELKALINNGIKEIPLNAILDLEKKWFQDEPSYFKTLLNPFVPSLTLSQIDWLKNHKVLSIGISTDLPPFEFIDKEGSYEGIGAEYIKRIETMLAVQFQYESDLNWNQVLSAIKAGKIDLLPMAVKTSERQKFLKFTESYLRFPLVIATHKRSPIVKGLDNLSGKKVAVEKGNPAEDLLKMDYPEIEVVAFDRVIDGLHGLEDGRVDALVHNSAVISHIKKAGAFDEIEIAAFTEYDLEISMAVRKDLEAFVNILEKALDQIDNKERSSINNKWLAIQVDLGSKLKNFFKWAFPIVVVLLMAFLFLIKINRQLQTEISRRSEVEKSLEKAKSKAMQASRAKDDFLANMSHEIRTPMNAVIGMSDLLSLSKIDDTQKRYIDTLKISSKALLSLINQILDLSKMEAGKLQMESVEFDLYELLDIFVKESESGVKHKSVQKKLHIQKDVPRKLIGDAYRLRQLIANLMDNAEKYTEKGEIKISVSLEEKIGNRINLHFVVSDTGIGIRSDRLSGLFDGYIKPENNRFEHKRGGGIGLAICLKLSQLMKGKIWVESQFGKGSQFHFVLEFYESAESLTELSNELKPQTPLTRATDDLPLEQLAGKKILLVDDNQTNRMIAQKMLERVKIEVMTAQNGLECLLLLSQNRVDGVLMDLQMPIMDGFRATRKIRASKEFEQLPIIALSANVASEDVRLALEAGMNKHLPKPIVMRDLYSTLLDLIV